LVRCLTVKTGVEGSRSLSARKIVGTAFAVSRRTEKIVGTALPTHGAC
jgi:hypothetical protein